MKTPPVNVFHIECPASGICLTQYATPSELYQVSHGMACSKAKRRLPILDRMRSNFPVIAPDSEIRPYLAITLSDIGLALMRICFSSNEGQCMLLR